MTPASRYHTDPGRKAQFFESRIRSPWGRRMIAVILKVKPARGRKEDYRLRIVSVIRDYSAFDRAQAPSDSQKVHKA